MRNFTTAEDVKHEFYPVAPASMTPVQKQTLDLFQQRTAEFAQEVLELVPEGNDRTYIMRQLLSLKFMGVQAITHTKIVVKETKATNVGFGKVIPTNHSTQTNEGKATNGEEKSHP